MKKIFSVLLIVCMMSAFITGCGKNGEFPGQSVKMDDEQLVKQTVTDYVNSIYAFDFEKALETVSEGTELYTSVEQMKQTYSMDGLIDAMFDQLSIPVEYKEKITNTIKDWIVKMMDDSKLDFLSTEIDGDNATVYVKMSTPDLTMFADILQNYDKYITQEQLGQLMQKYSLSLGENTKWNLIVEVLPLILSTATKDIEYVDAETKITLSKQDGKWLIVSDEL